MVAIASPKTKAADAIARLEAQMEVRGNPAVWLQMEGAIQDKGGRLVKFPELRLNEFQRQVVDIYKYCIETGQPCRIVILKPRQKGSSTISLALLYTHLRNFCCTGGILGDDKNTTGKLMEIFHRYTDNDRWNWGNTPDKDGMGFSHGSKLYEETANDPRAGMGGTFQFVLASEAAYYRPSGKATGEAVFQSLLNCVPDLPNTCVIIESTANGQQGVYYETYNGAITFDEFKAGKRGNGYVKVFYPWFGFEDSKPLRKMTATEGEALMNSLDEWESRLMAKYGNHWKISAAHLQWRRDVISDPRSGGDPRRFDVEYPSDDITCFRGTGNNRFDLDGLDTLDTMAITQQTLWGTLESEQLNRDGQVQLNEMRPPVFQPCARSDAWLRVWEPPRIGCRYLISADFMTGEQAAGSRGEPDCHAVSVWRDAYTDSEGSYWPVKQVAAIPPDCRVDLDVLCDWISLMSREYGNCVCAPEVNNMHGIIEMLRRRGVPLWCRRRADETKPVGQGKIIRIPGWLTTANNKRDMIDVVARLVREEEISIPCERTRHELRVFQNVDGKLEAAAGWHDDWVMSSAIGIKCLPSATLYQGPIGAGVTSYSDFGSSGGSVSDGF